MEKELYQPFVSSAKNKKYSVYVIKNNKVKLIHFGSLNHQHYFDKIGSFSHLNHLDETRRRLYLQRSKRIRTKDGELSFKDKSSPNYWSINYLW